MLALLYQPLSLNEGSTYTTVLTITPLWTLPSISSCYVYFRFYV